MSRPTPGPAAIEAEMLRRLDATPKSICPSEVARGLEAENWRPLMHLVRQAAARLSAAGEVEILRKGKPIPPEAMHGVIRLRRKRAEGQGEGAA